MIDANKALTVTSVLLPKITTPSGPTNLDGLTSLEIKGSVLGNDLSNYKVFWGFGSEPTNWNLLNQGSTPINEGVLASWNLTDTEVGVYTIKLEATNSQGLVFDALANVYKESYISQITNSATYDDYEPDIWQDRVVYIDDIYWGDIHVYDIKTKVDRKITNRIDTLKVRPRIFGDTVIWIEDKLTNPNHMSEDNLYSFNLTTNTERQLTTGGGVDWWTQAIYGDKIAYTKRIGTSNITDVYVYNLASSSETKITNSSVDEGAFFRDIYENKVYYVQNIPSSFNYKLIEHNLNTNEKKIIIAAVDGLETLRVWQNKIFYQIFTGQPGTADPMRTRLYVLDLQTNITKQLGSDSNKPSSLNLDIWQNKVVWTDKGELYSYDLDLDKESKITSTQSRYVHPDYFRGAVAIFGNRVVFESAINNSEIAIYDPPPAGQYNAQYFDNTDLTNRTALTTAPKIGFNWGSTNPAGTTDGNFSARFSNVFLIEAAVYRLNLQSDSGGKLYVDGTAVIDSTKPGASNTTLTLLAGPHTIKVEYSHLSGSAQLYANFVNAKSCYDLTGDYKINSIDQLVLNKHFNSIVSPSNAPWDLNGDGKVNSTDQLILSQKFNTTCQ